MRRLTLASLSLIAVFMAVGCEDSTTNNILEPSFGKVPGDCAVSDLLPDIYDRIDIVYAAAPNSTRNSVKSHVDNVANEVCDEDWAQARDKAWTALQQVDQQVGDLFLTGPEDLVEALAQLWTDIFALTCQPGEECIHFPVGAFEATGGIGKINPRKGGAVLTRNGEGAVDAGQDDFSGTDDVFLVLSRIPDSEIELGLYPGYSSFKEGYYILGSYDAGTLTGEVLVQMCVDLEALPPGLAFGDLKLGHVEGDGASLTLLDAETEGLIIEDACAGLYVQAPEPPSNWLQSVGRLASTTIRRVFGPEPLHAWYATKRGLGGLTGTFSPFAPMYPYQSLEVTAVGQGTVSRNPEGDSPPAGACTSGTCYPVGEEITLTAVPAAGWAFDSWTLSGTTDTCGEEPACKVTMDKDGVSVTATFVPSPILAHTSTTCEDFVAGTASEITEVLANGRDNVINSVAPGVFFYYFQVSADGTQTVNVNQSTESEGWPDFAVHQGQAYLYTVSNGICSVAQTATLSGDGAQAAFGSPASGSYVIGIKYNTSAAIGQTYVGEVTYTFETSVGDVVVNDNFASLVLSMKN